MCRRLWVTVLFKGDAILDKLQALHFHVDKVVLVPNLFTGFSVDTVALRAVQKPKSGTVHG